MNNDNNLKFAYRDLNCRAGYATEYHIFNTNYRYKYTIMQEIITTLHYL